MDLKNRISVIQGDITKIAVDAIVNAANTSLMGGGGVDGAIHRAGGPQILDECRDIIARQGKCNTGEAVITKAGKLPADYVIHTVGPVWNGEKHNEGKLLASCYRNSLEIASNKGIKIISFPNISTGIYHFPKQEAAEIALKTVTDFLSGSDAIHKVIFVCYDEENFSIYSKLIGT
ncbi:O-acetyl-ADP-ribose deacetylase [Pedobacter sp. HMF7647]|uniref:O-acetyl-ADP-ribose deacetylase n=1 Tax=Hufsiella arboris TaxID=2695275 RepID=A0A7K1YCI3_9SPHI|nr:O-acetyl-ADP-ribose deacetylase [Hufsiella arboris]MXV52302.1 O-acetyl-ADP-ribose deacetylase [Hufsiella arboris]